MRDEAGEHAPWVKAFLRSLQRGSHFGRVMRVIVDEGDAANLSADLKASGNPLKPADRVHR